MEKKTYNQLTKNIPLTSDQKYKLENENIKRNRLKILHCLKQVKEFSAFEKDLIAIDKDVRLTFTDKTSNMYPPRKEEYNNYGPQLLQNIEEQIQKSKIK